MCSNKLQNQITSLGAQIDKLCIRIEEQEIAGRDPKPLLIEYRSLLLQRAQLQKQLDSLSTNGNLSSNVSPVNPVIKETGSHAARTA